MRGYRTYAPKPSGYGGYSLPTTGWRGEIAKYGLKTAGKYLSKAFSTTRQVQTSRYGVKRQVVRKRRRGKGPQSLIKRVRNLEKNQDIKSRYTSIIKRTLQFKQVFGGGSPVSQQKVYAFFTGVKPTDTVALIDSLQYPSGVVNLDTIGFTKTKIVTFDHFVFKNANLYTVHIKMVKVKCKDHSSLSPISALRNEALSHGYTFTNTVVPAAVAAVGFSGSPEYMALPATESHYQVMSMSYNNALRQWNNISSVQTIVLNPGDSFDVYMNNEYNYEPEVLQVETSAPYISGWSYGLVLEAIGELAHGNSGATADIIGYSDWDIDCSVRHKIVATVDNGLGLDTVVNTSDITTPGPVTAWVQAGANNEIQ